MKNPIRRRLATACIVISILVLFSLAFTGLPRNTVPTDPLEDALNTLKSLGGFAALVPVLISLGKVAGVVQDGTSQNWMTGLNLVALVCIFIAKALGYVDLIPVVDGQAGVISQLLTAVLMFSGQIGISKLTYQGLRTSLLGFSFNPAE